MKGSYIIIAYIPEDKKIEIGKLGKIEFKHGYYAYVGSAMNSLEARIKRHLRKEKKMKWHIDFLLQHATIKKIFYKESLKKEECEIAKKFEGFEYIPKFGSSDCKCKSHLFYSDTINKIENVVRKEMKEWNKD